jgi:CBS domain-containing protein
MQTVQTVQTVAEIMTRDVQSVAPQDSLRRAAQLMDDLNVGALPVCAGDKLVGIVTDRDITVRGTSAGMAPEAAHVEQVMSTDVRSCHEDQPVDEVMRQMADTQIRRIPVLAKGNGKLVGMLSLGDIATRAAAGAYGGDIGQVMERVSFPSEPDRSSTGSGADAGAGSAELTASDTGTASGLLGSDVLADRMNPGVEVSSTGDPSEVVEVTPNELVNRKAPGSRIPNTPDGARREQQGVTVRHVAASGEESGSGNGGAPGGTDAAGAGGASGGSAGTSGEAGVGAGQQGM